MRTILFFLAVLVATSSATSARAQAVRTFVSAQSGSDGNPCSRSAPCRTFAYAYGQTAAGGEINTLDPGGYGSLTISKAISIVNGGGFEAGIAVPAGGIGINITAGTNDAVSLQGLTIDGGGFGGGINGIKFTSGASLTVDNCVIRHMTFDGIDFSPTNATSALIVSDSLVADNGNRGIFLSPQGSATAVFHRVKATNNAIGGIIVDGSQSAGANTIKATVYESVAAGSTVGSAGFYAYTLTGQAPTSLLVFNSVSANNVVGIEANGTGATLRLANSAVTGNTNSWVATNGGVVASYGDNYIDGNGSNIGALTSVAKR